MSSLPELSQKDTQKGELVNTDLFDDDAVSIDDDSDPFYKSELFPTEVSQPLQPKVVDEMAVDELMNVPNADVEMRKNAPVGPPEIAAVAAHDDADVEMRENAPVGPEIAAVAAHDDCEVGEGVFPLFDPFLEYLYFRFGFTFPPEGPEYPNIQSLEFSSVR